MLIDLSSWYKGSLVPKIEVIQNAIENRHTIQFTYGKSDVCYELIRTMQLVGINVITRTEVEECFAVIDDEIVWHGGMNLLGKADVWDNLMRIRNSQVATELLEIALGCSEERRKSE